MKSIRIALLAALVAALPALADQHPNQKKGFNPENVYYAHDIDTVNAFNGNLTLSIPIGPEFPVAEGFSYRLMLHGNSNVWDSLVVDPPPAPPAAAGGVSTNLLDGCTPLDGVTVALPHRRANAGMGWILTLGRLYDTGDPSRGGGGGGWMYESPDGSEHMFGGLGNAIDPPVMYTDDGTYLRMKLVSEGVRTIEFPDGSIHTFKPSPTGRGPWLPTNLARHGVAADVDIAYTTPVDNTFDWIISDSHGRTHTVHFTRKFWDGGWKALVTSVDLAAFGGVTATYQFNYKEEPIGHSEWHEGQCPGFNSPGRVQLLDTIVLPDDSASTYSFKYAEIGGKTSGLPLTATLPTGGVIGWTWEDWAKPEWTALAAAPYFANSMGVATRTRKASANAPEDVWTYSLKFDGTFMQGALIAPHEMQSLVLDPEFNTTVSYFSIAKDDGQWQLNEYGKPFSKNKSNGVGKWISQAQYGPGPGLKPDPATGTLLRSTYLTYEHENFVNWRVSSTRVVHDTDLVDGVAQWTDSTSSDWDFLGHYRTTLVSASSGNVVKKTMTAFEPTATSFSAAAALLASKNWILGRYSSVDKIQITAFPDSVKTEIARTEYCMDEGSGRLKGVRTIRGGGAQDLLTVYEADADGNVTSEKYYGGDGASATPANTCDGGTGAVYTLNHTYKTASGQSAGVRLTTKALGVSYKSLDVEADRSTGLVSKSTDPAGVVTTFDYNRAGQLTTVVPAGQAWTRYTYAVHPDEDAGGSVFVRQWPSTVPRTASPAGTPLTDERYYYDAFGRMIQQRRRMPDEGGPQWTVTEAKYDILGRKATTSVPTLSVFGDYEALASGTRTTHLFYDPLGRVKVTQLPNGKFITTTYAGARRVARSAEIAISLTGSETKVWNAEKYDAFGRLVAVTENTTEIEPGTPTAGEVSTLYDYDEGDRLAHVYSGDQEREFLYDGAGLLIQEDHPELARTYYTYDARGHVKTKTVTDNADPQNMSQAAVALQFTYNAAEQLETVKDRKNSSRLLKEFVYDPATGRLDHQTRHNHFPDTASYFVTDTFTYEPVTGRPKTKVTAVKRVEPGGAESTQEFTHNYDYTDLGAPANIKFPTCPTCGSASTSRTLNLSYDQGLLTGIQNVTTAPADPNLLFPGISYTPAGAVHYVQHAKANGTPGVLDTFEPDAFGMGRIQSIKFENAVQPVCVAPTAAAQNVTIDKDHAAQLTVTATGTETLHYQWFQGLIGNEIPVGNDAPFYPTPVLTEPADYWVRVTNACGSATASVHVSVVVCVPPAVTAQGPPVAPNAPATLTATASGSGTLTYQWYRGTIGDLTNPVGTNATLVTDPLTAPADFWVKVSNGCGTASTSVHVDIIDVCTGTFTIQAVPAALTSGAPFQLRAPSVPNATYRWYRVNGAQRTLLGTTTVPAFDVTSGITEETRYVAEIQNGTCTVSSSELVLALCLSRRPVSALLGVESVRVSVVDDQVGVTFQWYEGTDHQDLSRPLGTDPVFYLSPVPTVKKTYWVRMTRSCGGVSKTVDSDFLVVDPKCLPFILVQPLSATTRVTGTPAQIAALKVSAKVTAGGSGPFTYQWIDGPTSTPIPGADGPTFEWTYPGTNSSRNVYVEIKQGLNGLAVRSELITLAFSEAFIVETSGNVTLTSHLQRATLFVTMDPPETAGVHEYEYEWYADNGTPQGEKIGLLGPSWTFASSGAEVYWVVVRGVHHRGTANEYTAFSISDKMLVRLSTACALPPLRVEQSLREICLGVGNTESPMVTFRAIVGMENDVTYQWYLGQTGDTRTPLESVPGKPNETQIQATSVNKVWVRVTHDCGATRDSATISYTRGDCAPLIINQTVAPVNVEWGAAADVVFAPLNVPNTTYRWYIEGAQGALSLVSGGTGSTLHLTNVIKSARYAVYVTNSTCSNSGSLTFPTLVRVASAPGMTPPTWATEVWTDSGTPATLHAVTTGGVRWQWFRGEVLDETNPVSDSAVESFTTPALTADAKYWVRVSGTGGKFLDSPTITVKVCNPPQLTVAQQQLLVFDRDVLPNQETTFFVPITAPATGSPITYQWFKGPSLDTTHALAGENDIRLDVRQWTTTQYWFRASTSCGLNGSSPRFYNSPTFTAWVCATPEITTQPTATPSRIFTGATATLAVVATVTTQRPINYQWYAGAPGDTSAPVTGATTASVSVSPGSDTTYWVRITSGACSIDSAAVTVSRCTYPQTVNLPASVNIGYGETATITFPSLFPGDVKTIRWYRGAYLDRTNLVAGGNLPFLNFTTPALTATTQYWMEFEHNGCLTTSTAATTVNVCKPAITGQPISKTVPIGTSVTSTVTTTPLPGQTFQWYLGAPGNTSTPLGGYTTASVTANATMTATVFVRVTGTCTPAAYVDSDPVTITVCNAPVVTTTNFIRSIQPGQQTAVGVSATGPNLTYQWYLGNSGNTTNAIVGATDVMKYVSPSTTTSYWCRVTSEGVCFTDSETMTVDVCSPPVITQQPIAVPTRIFSGSNASLSVTATGNALTYQWYSGNPGTITSPVAGATTPTVSVSPSAQTTYWVRVTSGACSIDSNAVTVSMCTYNQGVTLPANVNIGYGETTTLAFPTLFPGDVKTIRWYRGAAGDRTNLVAGGNVPSLSFTTPALTATTQYWMEFEHNGCLTTSTATTVTVCKPAIVTQPSGSSIASGSTASLAITVSALPGQTFQWYTGTPGDTANPLAGKTTATITVAPTTTTSYWVRVTGTCTPTAFTDSAAATVTVCVSPAVTTTNFTRFIQSGQQTAVGVSATGTNLTYQWYIGNSGNTASPIAGATDVMKYVTPTTTTSYWCRVTSNGICFTNSETMTVDVCNPPAITQQPVGQTIFAGNSATLSVTATSPGAMTYQWYTGASGTTTSPVAGATSSTLTVSPTVNTSYWVRVTTSVCTVNSAAATIALCTYPATVTLPATTDIAYGETATIAFPTVSPGNVSKYIRWYRGASGDRTNLVAYNASATSLNYTTPALTANAQYWVEFEHNGCVTTSNAITVRVCKPTITSQPTGTTIAPGSPATLTVATTPIPGQTYQWYTGTPGNTSSPLTGFTTASVTGYPGSTNTYWVRVKGSCTPDAYVDSVAVTVIVCAPPTVTTTNFTTSIQSGQQTAVGVSATGNNLTYQWYIGTAGTTTSPIAGATDAMRYVSPTTTTSYWCRVTADGLCSTNSATMTVNVCNPPTITQQPIAQKIFSGNSATLSVTATSSGAMTYQWYTGVSGSTTSPVSGATSSSVTVSPTADTSYWCRVTTSVCSTNSAAATVSMCTYQPTFSILATRDIAYGESTTLTFPAMSPANEAKTIRWYRGASGDHTNLVASGSAVSLNYTTPFLTANTQYWVEFDHNGCTTTSNTVTVRVCKPTITTPPQNATILGGTSRTLTVVATGSPLTYQWYIGDTSVTSQPIGGATSASLTVTPSTTTMYWVRVTGCTFTADSAAATITVCNSPVITSVNKTSNTNYGGSGAITVNATGETLTYQWYKGQSGTTTQPISGATAATYGFTLVATDSYWVRVTSACGNASTDSATVLYSVGPNITTQPASITIPRNTSTKLTVVATGANMTYQWIQGSGTVLSGATSSTYTTPSLSTGVTEYWCQVTSGAATTNSVHAFVSLCDGPVITGFTQTYNSGSTYRLTVTVTSSQVSNVDYFWYSGVPGDLSQSISLGESPYGNQQYFNVSTPTTYWVRVKFKDGSCYKDTTGYVLP